MEKNKIIIIAILFFVSCDHYFQKKITINGPIEAHLKNEFLEIKQIFSGERFPNVVVTPKGAIIATWGSSTLKSRVSMDGGKTWSDTLQIAKPGFQSGGLTVNDFTGEVIAFSEAHHPPADKSVYLSKNQGLEWSKIPAEFKTDNRGNIPDFHMNGNGITLHNSRYRGRLIRPSRYYAGKNDRSMWPKHYTTASYSDDGGKTWIPSEPFPGFGFGEASIIELSNGTLYYNSRRHWAPANESPLKRWIATSVDGGHSWTDIKMSQILPDGPQDTNYGCMGGLTRLPVAGMDIILYSNCDSPSGRNKGTVWASFDGGNSWPIKRRIFEGNFAYSSMDAGRPRTITEGRIYLNFEGGPKGGSNMAIFNLTWVLKGEKTGNGVVPNL